MALEDILRPYLGDQVLSYELDGNPAVSLISALIVFLLSLLILRIFKFIIVKRLRQLAKKTRFEYDDMLFRLVDKVGWPFYAVLSIYLASRLLSLPQILDSGFYYLFLIVTGYYIINVIGAVIDFSAKSLVTSGKEKGERVDHGVVNLLAFVSKAVLWSVIVILIISNMGYDTSALLTGLGIGGIAIALALQTVLSDVFAYFSIHLDKPFRVGDFIVISADMGTVEKIGIKTTRIRTLQGQELVVSNKELTESRINNFKRMEKRRITFNVAVSSATPAAKLERIPSILKQIIEKSEHAQFDRAHFKSISDFSHLFEVVYYMTTPDYNAYMDTQQGINIEIIKKFDKEGIEIPFPTQTIHVSKRS